MPLSRLSKPAALLGAASLLVFPAMFLHAQPPAPAPARTARAQEKGQEKAAAKPATDPIERIKEEAQKNSKVMETLSHIVDVIGPRLTGSPELKRANEWTRDALSKWGLENAHLEAWGPFGRGWTLKRFSMQVVEPQCIPLIAYPKAWSPGTEGTVVGEVVYFDAKTDADFAKYKGKLKGKIILATAPTPAPDRTEPVVSRKTDKQLLDLADAVEPGARGGSRRQAGGPAAKAAVKGARDAAKAARDVTKAAPTDVTKAAGREGQGPPSAEDRQRMMTEMRARMEAAGKRAKFLTDEGVAALLDGSAQGDAGTLFVAQASAPVTSTFPTAGAGAPGGNGAGGRRSVWDKDAPKMVPQITVAKEHYNRLVRMTQAGETLKIQLELSVQFHDGDLMAYNTIAEIPGTDLKEQVVMVGGHLDSWHGGTGTTDNAVGCAAAMEAVRLIKALDLKPRRTVRIGLWSGEEQGLFGSRAYVTKHFGKAPEMGGMFGGPGGDAAKKKAEPDSSQTREFENFSAYFNLDNGAGKIRGIYLQGNEAARPLFRRWLQPFRELGAQTVTVSNTGGTDHQSFDGVGLPGFQFIQDELDYGTRTHHSTMDVYERAPEDDLKQASSILAAFLYNAANLDEKVPRKPAPGAGSRGGE